MHIYTFANLSIFSGSIQDVVHRIGTWIAKHRHTYVCVTGAHGIVEAQRNSAVMEAHSRAGLIVPDGLPLVWVGKAKGYKDTQRIYGPDLMLEICKEAQIHGWRIFLYGTTKETLDKLQDVLLRKYPHLIIVGVYSPPFGDLMKIERQKIAQHINQTRSNIIFVGLSTPKQELWMHSMTSSLHANVLIGVGAAFDFIAGTKKQAPRWVQQAGLEWAYRVLREPKRLLGRYIYIGPRFLFYVFVAGFKRMHSRLLGSRIARTSIVAALTVMLFCLVEFAARIVTDLGWVSYFHPIQIQSLISPSQKKEDWRLTHMMKDDQFVSDAKLFWKPKKNIWRFNADGYVGPVGLGEIDMAHKGNGCVVLALGDSNTQGIERNSWPEELDKLFLDKMSHSRVLNAGVAGYSSMQGRQKFNDEIDRIRPNVLFISFGWNDAAPSMGVPDSKFLEYYSPVSEVLNKLRLFLILKNWKTIDPLQSAYHPRVSLDQYLDNLQHIIAEAEKRGIRVVLLTRPYNSAHVEGWRTLTPNEGGWRMNVPRYNDVVRQVAYAKKLPILDIQSMTEGAPSWFIDDSHFTAAEHLDVALAAYDLIKRDNLCGYGKDI